MPESNLETTVQAKSVPYISENPPYTLGAAGVS